VKILALDTATESCSAALLVNERIATRERLHDRSAEAILPMVDELLAEAGVALAALDAIAFGRGPGAFTGVRLAASVTQGLAFGAGVPVVPVSDLQALAQRALDEDDTLRRVIACMDARMHEVYWGCFERGAAGLARPVAEERLTQPAGIDLPRQWVDAPERLAGVGSGLTAYPSLRKELPLAVVLEGLMPRAGEIARLALPEVTAGRFLPAEQALPVYLRDDVTRTPAKPS
jgi:tRNA threonylcarbamoyladenosine biosynthesis protein TsaB